MWSRSFVNPTDRPIRVLRAVAPRATIRSGAELKFSAQPPRATLDFTGVRFVMKAPFAASFELEVLDRIGHVTERTVDAGFLQTLVDQPARGSDERLAGDVLLISWLFANWYNSRLGRAFAEHGLGGMFIEIAAFTGVCLSSQCGKTLFL